MKIEVQRTYWMEFVYNKVKSSDDVGDFSIKVDKMSIHECEIYIWHGAEIVYNIFIGNGICYSQLTTERLLEEVSNTLDLFIDNVTPLFLDSITSLSYTDSHAKAYVENVQKIKSWYDKGLFGKVENNFPAGAPQQLPQAHQL